MKKKFRTFLCVGQIPFFMFFGVLQWEQVIADEQIEEIVVEGKYLSIDINIYPHMMIFFPCISLCL